MILGVFDSHIAKYIQLNPWIKCRWTHHLFWDF